MRYFLVSRSASSFFATSSRWLFSPCKKLRTNLMSGVSFHGLARLLTTFISFAGSSGVSLRRWSVTRSRVASQPSAQNGYTTTVRIQDPRGGADTYRLVAYWQNYSNGEYIGRNRGRARGRDRDNNGIYDNRNRDDIYRGRDNPGSNGQYGQYGNQTALHWSGNVDDELEIRIQNGQVNYRTVRGAQPTSIRADAGNLNMSRNNATLNVVQNQGRGSVSVIQQPSQWNGYTTVIRIKDPQGGYGYYDFNLIWQ